VSRTLLLTTALAASVAFNVMQWAASGIPHVNEASVVDACTEAQRFPGEYHIAALVGYDIREPPKHSAEMTLGMNGHWAGDPFRLLAAMAVVAM